MTGTAAASQKQALHVTGDRLLVSRDIKLLQRPRQVSLLLSREELVSAGLSLLAARAGCDVG